MSKTQPNEWLEWICSSQNIDELRENYEQWAETYESDVEGVWSPVPISAALMLAKYMLDKRKVILDVGAGTGLVGLALAKLGFEQIIGIDISPSMLHKAEVKGVYRSLVCCSIGDEFFGNLEKASGVIATGVFAKSHAGAAELRRLPECIESEGVLIFTVRQTFLPELQDVLEQPEWTFLDEQVMPIYSDPIHLLAYAIHHRCKS